MSKIGRDQIEMKIKMSNILYKRILAFLTYTIGGENSFCQAYSEFFESLTYLEVLSQKKMDPPRFMIVIAISSFAYNAKASTIKKQGDNSEHSQDQTLDGQSFPGYM